MDFRLIKGGREKVAQALPHFSRSSPQRRPRMFFFKTQPDPRGGGGGDDSDNEVTLVERIIPSDVLINILIRLPAWSLQKFKSVSKEWFRIISNPDFAEAHVAYQSRLTLGNGIIICSSQDVLFIEGTSSSTLNPPRRINLPRFRPGYSQVHGSSKGLVLYEYCLRDNNANYIHLQVANPLTGDSLSLPILRQKHSFRSASIGCSSSSREIKVVLVLDNQNEDLSSPILFFVLTLGSNKWRCLPTSFPQHHFMPYAPPTSARGALHWRYANGILSLDLGQEKFHQTDITFYSEFRSLGRLFCEWDGCLAFVHSQPKSSNQLYRVWVLRESGWTQHELDIDSKFFRCLRPWENFSDSGLDCPYFSATLGNGQILLFWKTCKDEVQLLAYDMNRKVLDNFTQFERSFFKPYTKEECWSNNVHVNSLVSCSSKASREAKIKFPAVLNVLLNNITSFACVIADLFR